MYIKPIYIERAINTALIIIALVSGFYAMTM